MHLEKYIPFHSINRVQYLIEQNNFSLKIVNERKTKHGDFRKLNNGKYQITINNNLNKYQFLLTLVLEIAHHITHQKFGRVKPHGREWKTVFQRLMIPFLDPNIYPKEILPYLANYLKNPKASTDSDPELSFALSDRKLKKGNEYLFKMPIGESFIYRKKIYKKGKLRRTRFECLEIKNNAIYLFHKNTEIELINS